MQLRFLLIALLLFSAEGISLMASNEPLLEWRQSPAGDFRLVLIAQHEPITILMVGSKGYSTVQMAPTDTYVSNTVSSGPIHLRPFCNIQTYDHQDNPIERGFYGDISLLEVNLMPPGYIFELQIGDQISLDMRTYASQPIRAVVRLVIRYEGKWKELILEKK